MFKRICLVVYFLIGGLGWGYSQPNEIKHTLNWLETTLVYPLLPKWYVQAELQWRMPATLKKRHQYQLRPLVGFRLSNAVQLSTGYTRSVEYPFADDPLLKMRKEHNVLSQVEWRQTATHFTILHRYRYEARFIESFSTIGDYPFSQRVRYRLRVRYYPVLKAPWNDFYLTVSDELFLQLAPGWAVEGLDRNRFRIGIGYHVRAGHDFSLTYSDQYEPGMPVIHERIVWLSTKWQLRQLEKPIRIDEGAD